MNAMLLGEEPAVCMAFQDLQTVEPIGAIWVDTERWNASNDATLPPNMRLRDPKFNHVPKYSRTSTLEKKQFKTIL